MFNNIRTNYLIIALLALGLIFSFFLYRSVNNRKKKLELDEESNAKAESTK